MSSESLLDLYHAEDKLEDQPCGHTAYKGSVGQALRRGGGKKETRNVTTVAIVFAMGLAVLGGYLISWWIIVRHVEDTLYRCDNPGTRYEWRTLSDQEQNNYLDALDCLRSKSSRLGQNHTLYDDFPYIHMQTGGYSHNTAPFLAWHRWFVYTFEQMLRSECYYTGYLPYWDWTLDWQDITKAPVWSNKSFGTTGNPNIGPELLGGYCVVDGRFAYHQVPFLRDQDLTHCLSRGFVNQTTRTKLSSACRPSKISEMMLMDDFEAFYGALEKGPHDAIPHTVRGDFQVFTAPSDPVFYLHHAQLDRVWKLWQDHDPRRRLEQVKGLTSSQESFEVSLDDVLPFGGLVPDVTIRDVLNTENDEMCYRY